MPTNDAYSGVWILGDYRNYFQNRVTLQLIAKGKELAEKRGTPVSVVVLGDQVQQYAMEYVAHGADVVMVAEAPGLKGYPVEACTAVLARWVAAFKPEIFLAGATTFGRELFSRLAKRLQTGLSADCVALEMDPKTNLLIQTTPAFGGELMAEVVTSDHHPQMATVHPNVFKERPHNTEAIGRVIYPEVGPLPKERVEFIQSQRQQAHRIDLENASLVIVGGRGIGSKEQFRLLFKLADLLEGEVGATRPAVFSGWAEADRLIGQTGKNTKPQLLISIGTSGALQYVSGIQGAETIIAINRDPQAPIFKIADLGVVGDAATLVPLLLEALRKRR